MSSAKLSKSIMIKKITTILLSCSLVFGSVSFAFAAPTTADQYAQYSGTGWSYNSSSHNFIANNQLSNSVPYVILSYLRDMFDEIEFNNSGFGYSSSSGLLRGIDITGSGKSSGALFNIGKLIGLLNTNLMSQFVFTTNANSVPLYSWKNFIDTNLYSWSFSNGDFIGNFVNGIASVNNNIAYIANQLYSDNSNNRSLLNQALHKIVDFSNVDYTTILNNIKSNTDYLSGIKSDTGYLSDIKSDTSYLSGIKTGTDFLDDIFNKLNIDSITSYIIGQNYIPQDPTVYPQIFTYSNPISIFWERVSAGADQRVRWKPQQNSVSNIGGLVNVLNNNTIGIANMIYTAYSQYQNLVYNSDTNSLRAIPSTDGQFIRSYSLMDALYYIHNDLLLPLSKLGYYFADDETISAKRANASQTSSVLNNFTGTGGASASSSDFGTVKDSVSSVKSGVNTNVSASEALNIFNNSDGYGFWSTDCLNALDTTNSNRLLRSRGSDTPLYDDKLQALYNAMGVNND